MLQQLQAAKEAAAASTKVALLANAQHAEDQAAGPLIKAVPAAHSLKTCDVSGSTAVSQRLGYSSAASSQVRQRGSWGNPGEGGDIGCVCMRLKGRAGASPFAGCIYRCLQAGMHSCPPDRHIWQHLRAMAHEVQLLPGVTQATWRPQQGWLNFVLQTVLATCCGQPVLCCNPA